MLYFSWSQWSNVTFGQTPSTALLILYFPFTAAGRSLKHQKTLKQTVYSCFSAAAEIWQNFWVELVYFFSILLLLVEKLEIILNKHKECHWFLCSLFLFNFINKNVFLISMFLCFALVPKLVPRTVDFHWYWLPNTEFWYRDNTTVYIYACMHFLDAINH